MPGRPFRQADRTAAVSDAAIRLGDLVGNNDGVDLRQKASSRSTSDFCQFRVA